MTVMLERAISQQDSTHISPEVFDDLRAGRPVVVFDVESGRVVLALAAEPATTEQMAFVIQFGSGLVTVSLPADRCRVLGLPPMLTAGDVTPGAPTDFAVSVDAVAGVGTGISAADRARTVRALADDALGHADFTRPGHVLVVGVTDGAGASYGCARELANSSVARDFPVSSPSPTWCRCATRPRWPTPVRHSSSPPSTGSASCRCSRSGSCESPSQLPPGTKSRATSIRPHDLDRSR